MRAWGAIITGALSLVLSGCGHFMAANDAPAPGSFPAVTPAAPSALPPPAFSAREEAPAEPAPAPALWERVRSGLAFHTTTRPEVDAELDWYRRNPDFVVRALERGRPFLALIVDEIERRGMPLDLALLPVVESAFQPNAVSPSRAAGIWQFIPSTGLRFGLRQNPLYDGRRDVLASTRAALDYLGALHDRFDGDWLAAIAAYNCGERNVERAIAANEARGLATDFWSLDLPRETSAYVPRLIAVARVVSAPEAVGIALPEVDSAAPLGALPVEGSYDLALLGERAGLGRDALVALNPGHRRAVTGRGAHVLLVPRADEERVRAALAAAVAAPERLQVAAVAEDAPTQERYAIRKGDTLGGIAERLGVRLADLKRANRLHGREVLAIGRKLIVPGARRSTGPVAVAARTVPETPAPRTRGAVRHRRGSAEPSARLVHAVARGDTLWDLSRRYRVSVENLTHWNGIAAGARLDLGQQLVVAAPASPSVPVRTPGGARGTSSAPVPYVVQRGDSPWTISRRFGVPLDDFLELNGLHRQSRLQPGQTVVVRSADGIGT